MPTSTPWTSTPIPISSRFWTSWRQSALFVAIRAIWWWRPPVPARRSFLHWITSFSASRIRIDPAACCLWRTGRKFSSRACTPSALCSRTQTLVSCLWATISRRASTTCFCPSRLSTHRASRKRRVPIFTTTSSWMNSTMPQHRLIRSCCPTTSRASCWA